MASLLRTWVGLAALTAACNGALATDSPAPGVETAGTVADAGRAVTADASSLEPIVTLGPPDYVELGARPATFDLDVPTGTLGFTFDTNGVDVTRVTDPRGTSYVPGDRPRGPREEYRRLTRFPASSKMLAVPPGAWKIELAGPSSAVRVARQRTNDGQFHGGTVDLHVLVPTGLHVGDFLTGEAPVDAVTPANAAANPVVKQFLASFFRELKRITSLDRGTVDFGAADAKFVTIDSDDEQNEAFALAGPLSKLDQFGLHMLLTELVQLPEILGFAPSAGGIGFARPLSTVLVKLRNQKLPPEKPQTYINAGWGPGDLSAGVALHETFHLWGLPHTSEEGAGYDDGFSDDASCTAAQQVADPFKCPDGTSVVFPRVVTAIAQSSISPHQLAVIRGMPVYKPKL